VQWGGSPSIPIPYNASDALLNKLLPKLNGVLLTGGGLDLINRGNGDLHAYYKTAKKIYQYALSPAMNGTFPVLGICQGFELLAYLAAGDDKNALDTIVYINESRPVSWEVDPITESRVFSQLSAVEKEAMTNDYYAFHYHELGLYLDKYNSYPSLYRDYKLIATDEERESGRRIVTAFEHKDLPIYAIAWHPEY